MKLELVAKKLSELGHPTRLDIFRLLVKAGDTGLAVGALKKNLKIIGPTLTHHLHRLIAVNLVSQQRQGRVLYCSANLEQVRSIMQFLESECCTLQIESNKVNQSNQSNHTKKNKL